MNRWIRARYILDGTEYAIKRLLVLWGWYEHVCLPVRWVATKQLDVYFIVFIGYEGIAGFNYALRSSRGRRITYQDDGSDHAGCDRARDLKSHLPIAWLYQDTTLERDTGLSLTVA